NFRRSAHQRHLAVKRGTLSPSRLRLPFHRSESSHDTDPSLFSFTLVQDEPSPRAANISAGVDAAFSLTRMIPEADRKDPFPTDGGARAGERIVSKCAQT